ncbi:hypothetical protein KA005_49955, partial [bacterium]|nr:hypothetical protein [bacterium]
GDDVSRVRIGYTRELPRASSKTVEMCTRVKRKMIEVHSEGCVYELNSGYNEVIGHCAKAYQYIEETMGSYS